MFEIKKLKGNTYYIPMPTNIGIYRLDEKRVIVIDTGINEKSAGRIISLVQSRGWEIEAVILTHAHTDHAGGAKCIFEQTGAKVYASEVERIFVENPDLEPALVYGAFPCRDFRVRFMNTPPCRTYDIREFDVPKGMEFFSLPGHFADMMGVKTPDDVYFVADAVNSEKTLENAKICYTFNIETQYETLEWIKCLDGKLCVPSHAEPTTEIAKLARANKENLDGLCEYMLDLLDSPKTLEDLVQKMSFDFDFADTYMQYVMACAGVRTLLTCLRHRGKVNYSFKDKLMYWEKA
ncbi:MAG: MBL fold metallo-hydrolase [Eubacteriales bacterium]|nr:MBL fold metallo-hydrolase [Eubacteriales bacterium]